LPYDPGANGAGAFYDGTERIRGTTTPTRLGDFMATALPEENQP
jgi:hypothetical protein